MKRARLLGGSAALAAGFLLIPAQASAQIGPCPAILPPPCIVVDPGKIAGSVAEIAAKKKELEGAVQQVKEYTDLNKAIGKVGTLAPEITASITPSQSRGFAPLSEGPRVSISEASNAFAATLGGQPNTMGGKAAGSHTMQLHLRAAAGEGYAMAHATKEKLGRMNAEAERLTSLMQGVGSKSADMRTAWSINQGAKRLLYDAMLANREVRAARMQLSSVLAIPKDGKRSTVTTRREAPPVAPVEMPAYAQDIGDFANATAKLAALMNAKNIVTGFTAGIEGSRQTQAEYRQIKAAAQRAQGRVEAMAGSEARQKGVPASRLMSVANSTMARYDRTTWDSSNKGKAAEYAAKKAEEALDRIVRGHVDNDWNKRLETRAEAFKQEAFFRPIAEDAKNMETQTREALAQYQQSIGVDASNTSALAAAIAQAQAEVDRLYQKLASAPPAIVRKRDQILASSGINAARNLPRFVYPTPVEQPSDETRPTRPDGPAPRRGLRDDRGRLEP